MKRVFLMFLISIILIANASADIIITQQPQGQYNLGEIVKVPIKITTTQDINAFFTVDFVCSDKRTEIHKEFIALSSGEEKQVSLSVPITSSMTNNASSSCKLDAILKNETVSTNIFQITDKITAELKDHIKELAPEEDLRLEGTAKRQNGDAVNGFLEVKMTGSSTSTFMDTVKDGVFATNFTIPTQTKAGEYTLTLNIYEKDLEGQVSNKGSLISSIKIKQVPTTLDVVFENSNVQPGTNLKVKAILKDQTGEKISSNSIITIKKSDDSIVSQEEKQTDNYLEYFVVNTQAPEEWKVHAVSNQLSAESRFQILVKEDAKVQVENRTLIVTNTGNVPFTKTVTIKLGNVTVLKNVNESISVGESKRYTLQGPSGSHSIKVSVGNETKLSETVYFENIKGVTGFAVREPYETLGEITRNTLVWIFILAVLGLAAYFMYKRVYKKKFTLMPSGKKGEYKEINHTKHSSEQFLDTKNRAEVALSLQGEAQEVSMVCLRIKNFSEIKGGESGWKEILQKAVSYAEDHKVSIYENQNNIFFMFVPANTRTFDNQKSALHFAERLEQSLKNSNRLQKLKMEYGIAVSSGQLMIKKEKEMTKFMAMGHTLIEAKKIASVSEGEIYLSDSVKEKLAAEVKTEKKEINGVNVNIVREIKDKTQHEKFIKSFSKRMEEGKK